MALTATAPNKVQDDIIRVLGIQGCKVLKQSFNRPNLHYEVRPKKKSVLADMALIIATYGKKASGIIYCSSREKCEVIAKELRDKHEVHAWHYHAGMTKGDRRKVQEGWQDHKFEVIVATVSLVLRDYHADSSGCIRDGVSMILHSVADIQYRQARCSM
jgi:bloom syndrome protein